MAPPKRSAPRRTATAIAEDLAQVRRVGGLGKATAADLAATLDLLTLVMTDESRLDRARDLHRTYIRRGCERHRLQHEHDKTAVAAADSLERLLLRPVADHTLVQVVRRDAARAVGHQVSADAVRHREDRIVEEIAQLVFADLETQDRDDPQTLEAALHLIMPTLIDLRDQLHDGLCLTYPHVPPPNPREAKVFGGFYRQVVIKLGRLLVLSIRLAKVGMATAHKTMAEFWFVARSRNLNWLLFDEAEDRQFMYDFMKGRMREAYEVSLDALLSSEYGSALYERWVAWAQSCYPTCAFERTTDIAYMCSPHSFVTLLYEIEKEYLGLGYSVPDIEDNDPMFHHGLPMSWPEVNGETEHHWGDYTG